MANTPPQVTDVVYDQPSYTAGQQGQVTVTYVRGSTDKATGAQWVATDTVTNLTGVLTQTFQVSAPNPTTVAGTDDDGRVYTLQSDNDVDTAVFTFTA